MYPSTLAALTDPQAADRLNSPSHSDLHQSENENIEAIQAFVGTIASTAGTLIYDIRATASDGGGHVQTANKGGTGQTTYTKGDLLVASSASVLSKLAAPSTDNLVLTADSSQATGVKWGAGAVPTVRTYPGVGGGASSLVAIWNRPSIISYAIIEVQGGGGGGGGTTTDETSTSGGGGGGYSRKVVPAASLPIAASVIVGLGGSGGPGSGGAGGIGGTSYFGSVISATGGGGGDGTSGSSGAGGAGSGGDVDVTGGPGGTPNYNATVKSAGPGGSSYFGGGGPASVVSGNTDVSGVSGRNYGGGGSGAICGTGGDVSGGGGAPGIIVITEY